MTAGEARGELPGLFAGASVERRADVVHLLRTDGWSPLCCGAKLAFGARLTDWPSDATCQPCKDAFYGLRRHGGGDQHAERQDS